MTDWMPKPPVFTNKISARYYHLEPGDGTRYEFMVHLHPTQMGLICISGVGGAAFGSATVLLHELDEFIITHPAWGYSSIHLNASGEAYIDPFLQHLKDIAKFGSYMTGLAAVMAMHAFLKDEVLL